MSTQHMDARQNGRKRQGSRDGRRQGRPRPPKTARPGRESAGARREPGCEALYGSVPEELWPFIAPPVHDPDLIGAAEAARRLDVSRSTVYKWIDKRKLLGWRPLTGNTCVPHEQILGPGKVVPAIAEVVEIIEHPELAWVFLSMKWPFTKGVARPIDKLKAGKAGEVLATAPGFGTDFT